MTGNSLSGSRDQWVNYKTSRRTDRAKNNAYRKGPAPIEDLNKQRNVRSDILLSNGGLDSDIEDLWFEAEKTDGVTKASSSLNDSKFKRQESNRLANDTGNSLSSSRALIVYFSKLAKCTDENATVDLLFIEALLLNHADVNFPDKYGQIMLHEIAREWHTDIARFAVEMGADVNKVDLYGRTPLHVASASNYAEMIDLLVENGADIHAVTKGELQSSLHYAAKSNALSAMKALIKLGSNINLRDYRNRTPLFVACETAHPDAARFLLDYGAPVGVNDTSGTLCLSLMIEKMPHIAMEAANQFYQVEGAYRKHYYYLSYLELDRKFADYEFNETIKDYNSYISLNTTNSNDKRNLMAKSKSRCFARTPLEMIIEYRCFDLIMHPAFLSLLAFKWRLYGKRGGYFLAFINFVYTMTWTILALFLPDDDKYYLPLKEKWWRIVLEIIGILLSVYFIYEQTKALRDNETKYNMWRQWRVAQIEQDVPYCHPCWPEEQNYIKAEIKHIHTHQRSYFRDPWQTLELITCVIILFQIATRIITVTRVGSISKKTAARFDTIHRRVYAVGLVFVWLRLMSSLRVFRGPGVLISILGYVAGATLKFGFLIVVFFIPYTVGLWIIFGGENTVVMQSNAKDWRTFNDLTFSLWMLTVGGNFNWAGLVTVDRLMSQVMVGTYFVLVSIVCFSMYIALLSDTFTRVYFRAKANAVMQQAQIVLSIERNLSKEKKNRCERKLQDECCPLVINSWKDDNVILDHHQNQPILERITRQINRRMLEFENVFSNFNIQSHKTPFRKESIITDYQSILQKTNQYSDVKAILEYNEAQLKIVRNELTEIKTMALRLFIKVLLKQLGDDTDRFETESSNETQEESSKIVETENEEKGGKENKRKDILIKSRTNYKGKTVSNIIDPSEEGSTLDTSIVNLETPVKQQIRRKHGYNVEPEIDMELYRESIAFNRIETIPPQRDRKKSVELKTSVKQEDTLSSSETADHPRYSPDICRCMMEREFRYPKSIEKTESQHYNDIIKGDIDYETYLRLRKPDRKHEEEYRPWTTVTFPEDDPDNIIAKEAADFRASMGKLNGSKIIKLDRQQVSLTPSTLQKINILFQDKSPTSTL